MLATGTSSGALNDVQMPQGAALRTWLRRASGRRLCSARTRPATTALTASRWLGFGAMLIRTCRFAAPPCMCSGKGQLTDCLTLIRT